MIYGHPASLGCGFFNLVIHGRHNTAHVVSTFWADDVRGYRGTAFWADGQWPAGEAVMRAALTSSRIGMFSLGNGHVFLV